MFLFSYIRQLTVMLDEKLNLTKMFRKHSYFDIEKPKLHFVFINIRKIYFLFF
jgi:hypothetical protein